MKHRVRFLLGLLFLLVSVLQAQTIVLQPPSGYDNSTPPKMTIKMFYSQDSSVYVKWTPPTATSPSSLNFIIGTSSGNYQKATVNLAGATSTTSTTTVYTKSFKPTAFSLSTGRYYGLVTNGSERTSTAIRANSSNIYSNETQFIVESPNAPAATAPKGNVTTSTPTFQWAAIPGVPAYWIICSSTPFVVRTDSSGNPTVQGANIVWDYISTGTSAVYGQISPYSPFTQSAIPLFAGNTYYYTILNLYDATDVSYASSVFGGVVSFTYQSQSTISAPSLVSPADNAVFNAAQTIRFQWDAVPNANSYTLYLFNRVTTFAGSNQEIDLPIWNGNTTNTQLDFPARQNFLKGKYVWFVVPNSSTGAGVSSAKRVLNYDVAMSKFRIMLKSTSDPNNLLLSYSFYINSTTGGYSPSVPFIASNSTTVVDSVPRDIYRFTVSKGGYYDSVFTLSLTSTSSSVTDYVLWVRPYPSTVSGTVIDQANLVLPEATIQFVNVLTNQTMNFTSNSSGAFSVNLPQGSYRITVSKPGYLSPSQRTITVGAEQVILSEAFKLTQDKVTVSGKIINDAGEPVQLATVKATKGTVVQEATSNGNGFYSFDLSSGSWQLEANKTGFVSPTPVSLNLVTGNNIQNQNLILIPRANQVSGIVYKTVQSGTSTTNVPAASVTVTATPTSGAGITAVTNNSGQFQVSLRSGTYVFSVQLQGYTPNNAPQLTLGVGQTVSGVDFTLTPNPSSVSGLITDISGTALGDATVSNGTVSTVSLPTGNFQLSLPSGNHSLQATKAGHVTPASVTITLSPGQALSGVNFSLNPNAATITGTVTSLGLPLAGATITAVPSSGQQIRATTNNTGNFTISVQPGNWTLTASKQGFISASPESFFVGAGQTSPGHNYSLTENIANIKGLVSSGGQGLNNVTIYVRDKNNSAITFSTVTSINGEYSLSVPAQTKYSINGSLTGYTSFNDSTAVLTPKAVAIVNGTITPVPATISGKVTNNQNQALAQVKIYLTKVSNNVITDSTVTNINGQYTLGSFDGDYKVSARLPGYTPDNVNVTVGLGQALSNVNLTINPNYALLTGTVRENGNTISGALITLTGSQTGGSATSQSDGTYSITQLLGDSYTLNVKKSGYAEFNQTLAINDGASVTQNIIMQKLSGSLSGKVTDNLGSPVADATVTASSSLQTYSAVSNSSGDYSLPGIAFADYNLAVVKTGYTSPATKAVTLSAGTPTATVNLSGLKLNNSSISGKITNIGGAALSSVDVKVSGAGSAAATTGLDGIFSVTGLADGDYQLRFSKDGYVTKQISLTLPGNMETQRLDAANSTVSGTVKIKYHEGTAMNLAVPVKITDGASVLSTTTDLQGNFSFSNLSPGTQYTVYTEIFKDGYTNDQNTFTIPAGAASYGPVALLVDVAKSRIYGGVIRVGGATVIMKNKGTGESYSTVTSSDGRFSQDNIPDTTYIVTPSLSGYSFAPASREVTVAVLGSSDSLVFTATQNLGAISIKAKNNTTGAVMSGAFVSAISTDNLSQYSGTTGTNGIALFSSVVSGKTYTVRASVDGYTSQPAQKTIAVTNSVTASDSFAFIANSSSAKGTVKDAKTMLGLAKVSINYRNTATAQSYTATTTSSGGFTFSNLASGQATLTVTADGFKSTPVNIDLGTGKDTTLDIIVTPTFVNLTGRVMYSGSPVSGVIVKAVSSSSFTDTTKSDGSYTFKTVPIVINTKDTTIYKITISGAGIQGQTKSVKIDTSKVEQTITVPQFELPSGEINVTVTDGSNGLEGVTVAFIKPDGTTVTQVTNKSGTIDKFNKLSGGTYWLDLSKDEYFEPDTNLTTIKLSDNTTRNLTIPLRYRYTPIASMDASKSTIFKVKCYPSIPSNISAFLYYKQGSGAYIQKTLSALAPDTLSVTLDPLKQTAEVTYYFIVKESNTGVTYTSLEYKIKPEATGVLTTVNFTPTLNNLTLRKGDTYEYGLILRDGKSNSLNTSFVGATPAGGVTWEFSDTTNTVMEISHPKTNDKTFARLKILPTAKDGQYRLTVSATLDGTIIRQQANFTIGNVVLKTISINSSGLELSNKAKGMQFSYSGIDTAAKAVTLGVGLTWNLTPKEAGKIDSVGFFTPVDSTYIGTVTISAEDKISGKKGTSDLAVYAEIGPQSNIVLTDKKGMTLAIVTNSVPIPVRLTLDKQQFGPGKKYYTPNKSTKSYIVGNTQYPISYSADQALAGNQFQKAIKLTIPVDVSLKLFETAKTIGFYDFDKNEWKLVTTTEATGGFTTSITSFGEYSLLAENEPLGISKLSVLPTPFSPKVAPLKIGFKLSTLQRNASISIKIFNMRNELVRELMQQEQLSPNIYGSKDQGAMMEITWDGKTDDGKEALNGRYIIQVIAKDPTGDVSKIIPVVLVK